VSNVHSKVEPDVILGIALARIIRKPSSSKAGMIETVDTQCHIS
jgi:hypothetical protein